MADSGSAGAGQGPEARALVEAKLRPPMRSGGLVARPALLGRLEALAGRVLTLVSAPTGYGKTTLLAAWASGRPRTAWLSLDPTDDEPIRFSRAIVAAIVRVASDLGAETSTLLDNPVADVLGPVRISLVNELEDLEQPVTLILDDLHAIRSSTCMGLLAALLMNRPRGLRVVVSTRADPPLPLGRMRAIGQLGEVRVADLRFVRHEAEDLVTPVLGDRVTEDSVERLTARTEGWPAGLVLATMSADAAPDPQAFLDGFSGSDRNVVDYLAEEVLLAQPAETREFLVATSIVDELCGDLCDALTGRTDGSRRLESLARSNAFVVRLDTEGRWFRYHRLFREVLLTELAASRVDDHRRLLHRAATWYEARGLHEQAARSVLEAGDPTEAARVLATSAREMMRQGDMAMLRVLLAGLDHRTIGPMRSAVEVAEALAAGLAGDPRAVIEGHLSAAEAAGPLAALPFELPDVATARLFTEAAYLQDDVGRQARAAAVLRERFAEHRLLGWLGRAAGISAAYFAGDRDRARTEADAFGLEIKPEVLLLSIVVVAIASLLATDDGDLDAGETLAWRAHDATVAGRLADAHAAGLAFAALGAAHAARGDPEAALPVLERSLELRGRQPGVHRAHALLALVPVRLALGDVPAARGLVGEARAMVAECPDPGALPALVASTVMALGASSRDPRVEMARPSDAQLRVLRLLPTDLSYREIGRELYVSHDTVKSHIRALYRSLGVATRAEAVERASDLGLLSRANHPG